ncbi:hypothetical protein UFOVP597_37 [uncultured Caudovirales phage]|uniref:Uncharacterized protein n=1 Tax=uncultured Caudovirales phage TaxID=2100421 RepID=A0A6J5MZF5_9CAUD|nr:hypothetical protein UFOVP597_37 [uncultured Caudovirales phage]
MRKFDFDSKFEFNILDIKNLIERLMVENYNIDRIQNIFGISKNQLQQILKYKFQQPIMNSEKKDSDLTEDEMIVGVSNYSYDQLSPEEKNIFDKLK